MTTLAKDAHKPAAHGSASAPPKQTIRPKIDQKYIQAFVENLFGDDLLLLSTVVDANGALVDPAL
ncbi:uncharacterized protein SOCEGT47_057210 [Sorangium cellulosum]|uniref:Uncharacterized protein n=1 Tax=Sorangium cellulosum TaxID=56 RepID=A0A4P2Q6Q9_SORCE|nr:hypothetical protein [Sorangium cellulosum]AUX25177.1 uncharacterized protein SOCEGT47_057210 [Sorangium cellulosum]